MGRINVARKRSKTNPSHTCMVKGCNTTIFNKGRNAKYCEKCWGVMDFLIAYRSRILRGIKYKHKGYRIKVIFKLERGQNG